MHRQWLSNTSFNAAILNIIIELQMQVILTNWHPVRHQIITTMSSLNIRFGANSIIWGINKCSKLFLADELDVLHTTSTTLRRYTMDCIHLRWHYPFPSRFQVTYDCDELACANRVLSAGIFGGAAACV